MQGKLELMMGPMRSNKTAELQRRADMRRQYAKQYVLVLKPSDDTKGGPGIVESRNPNGGGKMSAVEFRVHKPVGGAARHPRQGAEDRQARGVHRHRRRPVCRSALSLHQASARRGPRCSCRRARSRLPRHALRRDAQPHLAGECLRRQHYRVHGLLQPAEHARSTRSGSSTANPRPSTAPSKCPATPTSRAAPSTSSCPAASARAPKKRGPRFRAIPCVIACLPWQRLDH